MSSKFAPFGLAETRHLLAQQGAGAVHERLFGLVSQDTANSVIATDKRALSAADDGPLGGIPFGVKDNINAQGFATTGGSPALRNYHPGRDAEVVGKLRAAGGYVPLKLNLHELAFGITSNNSTFGPVSTPFDARRCAGGSSGGNAVAIATGIVPFALGTDTGGSTRIPAAFCRIAGFRPSTGRYPSHGVLTLSTTRDTIGPMAANCTDLAEIDGLITAQPAMPDLPERPLRIGVFHGNAGLSKAVDDAFDTAIAGLENSKIIEVIPIPPAPFKGLNERMGRALVITETFEFWTRFCAEILGQTLTEFATNLASPDVRDVFADLPGFAYRTRTQAAAAYEGGLDQLRATYVGMFKAAQLDAILMPTVPVQPPFIGEDTEMKTDIGPVTTFAAVTRNTTLATLTGAPSVAIPAGLDRDRLPVSVMLEGARGSDRRTLAAAIRIEAALR